jgi:hypothetical protein
MLELVDLSHNNQVDNFTQIKAAGKAGIIHKATEFLRGQYIAISQDTNQIKGAMKVLLPPDKALAIFGKD